MTIRISASVLLFKPQVNDTARYHITTSRAIARTREDGELEFELKLFYDIESSENTVPASYNHDEGIHFTGNLTEVVNEVLHVNVQHAHSLGISPKIPSHCVEINLNGRIQTLPSKVSTDSQSTNFTKFDIMATQWVSTPRTKKNTDISNGKNATFNFVCHHPTTHRLTSRTSNISQLQNINVLGLLELIDKKLYIQLMDISWNYGFGSSQQSSLSQPVSTPQSRWTRDTDSPPTISSTRALAAKLVNPSNTNTSTNEESSKPSRSTKQTDTQPTDTNTPSDTSTSNRRRSNSKKRAHSPPHTPSTSELRTLRSSKRAALNTDNEVNSEQDSDSD